MFTEAYIEALLVDEDLADQVWELWDAGIVTDELAGIAWHILAFERVPMESLSYANHRT